MIRSLADFPTLAAAHAFHADPVEEGCVMFVIAPCCGRRTAADTVFDVRGVPGTVVSGGVAPPEDHDWLCDGCRWRLIADASNDWTASAFLAACGARPDTVRAHYLAEIADMVEQADHAAGSPHSLAETRAILDARLPSVIP
jgi:hypothetical protein